MKRFLAALSFLTILPVPARWAAGGSNLGASVAFFPLVGLAIGLGAAVLDAALVRIMPLPVATVFLVSAFVAISGGLHLDGFADTADGFFGARQREKILAIMKDSRSGPLAIAAVVLLIALKLAAIGALAPELRFGALVLTPLSGRTAIAVSMTLTRYARPEGGTGSAFAARRPFLGLAISIALLALTGWYECGFRGLVVTGISLLGALMFTAYGKYKIGGWTGDTLGAACELGEIFPALVLSAHIGGF
jgi:adenosylcobinamide-GDP ribazoletransferase